MRLPVFFELAAVCLNLSHRGIKDAIAEINNHGNNICRRFVKGMQFQRCWKAVVKYVDVNCKNSLTLEDNLCAQQYCMGRGVNIRGIIILSAN